MRIVVAGATGFLGKALVASLKGHEVVALVRNGEAIAGARAAHWDGKTQGSWTQEIDGADAIVNYAGSPVTVKLTDENRQKILDSRVQPTSALSEAIARAPSPPKVWINGSAVGYYGSREDEILDESSAKGTGFLADVCVAWEDALMRESLPHTRRIALRTGIVLGLEGGTFPLLLNLTKAFLGGQQGDGHQWVPWIHVEDHVAIVRFLLENEVEGPVNACGPAPCPNATLMAALREVTHRPVGIPAPEPLMELAGRLVGPDAEVTLASQRAIPKKLQDAGFEWRHPVLEEALKSLL